MPTGYTCNIHKGITFNEYALACARAFGACIDMRDSPTSEAIPEEFFPSTYHKEALAASICQLAQLQTLGKTEAEQAACDEYESALKRYKERLKEAAETKIKFLAMEAQAKAYVPPTSEHQGLKDFMLNQLEISASDYDVSYYKEPVKQSAQEWMDSKLEKCNIDIAYHERAWVEECERVVQRNDWVKKLRASLV